jgi:hypothetical protein
VALQGVNRWCDARPREQVMATAQTFEG